MRKWLILALIPGAFFATQLNAQTLRIDFNLSAGAQFDAEMEKRENTENLMGGVFNGDWKSTEGLSYGPIGLGYFHKVGPGRIYLGGAYSHYAYSATHNDMGLGGYFAMTSVGKYEYTLMDYEGGYEFKVGKVTLTPKVGRRSYEKKYEATVTSFMPVGGFMGFGTDEKNLDGDSSGLYAALVAEMELTDKLNLYIEGAKSMGPLTGSANMKVGSRAFVGPLMGTSSTRTTMDQEVDYTNFKFGFKIKPDDTLSLNIGIQHDTFSVSYPGRFDVTVASLGGAMTMRTSLDSIPNWMVTQMLWSKSYDDKRTGLYVGLTKDINF